MSKERDEIHQTVKELRADPLLEKLAKRLTKKPEKQKLELLKDFMELLVLRVQFREVNGIIIDPLATQEQIEAYKQRKKELEVVLDFF